MEVDDPTVLLSQQEPFEDDDPIHLSAGLLVLAAVPAILAMEKTEGVIKKIAKVRGGLRNLVGDVLNSRNTDC